MHSRHGQHTTLYAMTEMKHRLAVDIRISWRNQHVVQLQHLR